jgi:pimeloyl-ACP methyl ester carboxylesterase
MRLALVLLSFFVLASGQAATAASPVDSKTLTGDWYGALTVPGGVLHLKLTIKQEAGSPMSATLVSIDQGGAVLPVSTIAAANDSLHLVIAAVSASFEGRITGQGDAAEIQGSFVQGGAPLPLTFKRTGKPAEPKRPQLPSKPYPYREENVTYKNETAGVTFAATLTLPPGQGPFPAVLLITGSGSEDRDETLVGHRPFLVIADYLTRRGIAVLRADDRGVGGSTGDAMSATTKDLAGDALAGVAFLKARSEIDHKRIGLVGHSEGANIGSIAATQSSDVAYLVMLAGMGLVGEQVLYLQGWQLLEAQGAPKETVDQERALQEGFFAAVKAETDPSALTNRIRDVAKKAGHDMSESEIATTVEQIGSPWFRYFLTFDPAPVLEGVHCPVLVLYGDKDTQAMAKENAPAVEAALKKGGNKDVTVHVLPGLNHLFQTCKTGSVSEYGQIEETFAPVALGEIGDWILSHTKVKN